MARRTGFAVSAAVTSLSQAASMIAGGVIAVLVAIRIGNDATTDGFFAAYGLYSVGILFVQSARTTIVARLVEHEGRFAGFDRFLAGGLIIAGVAGIAFVPLGALLAEALTGTLPDEASETARTALLILWPAIVAQLFAALGAAMLGVLGDYVVAAVAFVGGGLVSIVGFLVLEPILGIDGLAVALLCGSVVSASVVGVALWRAGWRPGRSVRKLPAAGVLLISSLSFLLTQAGYVVLLAFGARLGEGVITIFTYSYMGMGLVMAVLVSSVPMVLAAPLAQTWDRDPATLRPHNEAIFRVGLLAVVPVVAAVWLLGHEVGEVVLAKFSAGDVDLAVTLFLLLAPSLLWGLATAVPYTAVMTLGRYPAVAAVTAVVVGVQIGLAAVAVAVDSPELLAASVPAASVISVVATLVLVSPGYAATMGPRMAWIAVRVIVPAFAVFGLPALVLPDVAAFPLGAALFALVVWLLLPEERESARRLVRALRGSGAVPA